MMQCPRCGIENEETARFCRTCGEPLVIGSGAREIRSEATPTQQAYPPQEPYYQPPVYPQPPMQGGYPPSVGYPPYYNGYIPPAQRPVFNSTNAIVAIICGFLCSWWIGSIFAIIGLVKGGRADTLWAMGDYQGAYNAITEGNKYVKISWIVSGAGLALVMLYFIAMFFVAIASAL